METRGRRRKQAVDSDAQAPPPPSAAGKLAKLGSSSVAKPATSVSPVKSPPKPPPQQQRGTAVVAVGLEPESEPAGGGRDSTSYYGEAEAAAVAALSSMKSVRARQIHDSAAPLLRPAKGVPKSPAHKYGATAVAGGGDRRPNDWKSVLQSMPNYTRRDANLQLGYGKESAASAALYENPTTVVTPRPYKLKPVEEKSTEVYTERRQRNNLAVRRSRLKSKLKNVQLVKRLQLYEGALRDCGVAVPPMDYDAGSLPSAGEFDRELSILRQLEDGGGGARGAVGRPRGKCDANLQADMPLMVGEELPLSVLADHAAFHRHQLVPAADWEEMRARANRMEYLARSYANSYWDAIAKAGTGRGAISPARLARTASLKAGLFARPEASDEPDGLRRSASAVVLLRGGDGSEEGDHNAEQYPMAERAASVELLIGDDAAFTVGGGDKLMSSETANGDEETIDVEIDGDAEVSANEAAAHWQQKQRSERIMSHFANIPKLDIALDKVARQCVHCGRVRRPSHFAAGRGGARLDVCIDCEVLARVQGTWDAAPIESAGDESAGGGGVQLCYIVQPAAMVPQPRPPRHAGDSAVFMSSARLVHNRRVAAAP